MIVLIISLTAILTGAGRVHELQREKEGQITFPQLKRIKAIYKECQYLMSDHGLPTKYQQHLPKYDEELSSMSLFETFNKHSLKPSTANYI